MQNSTWRVAQAIETVVTPEVINRTHRTEPTSNETVSLPTHLGTGGALAGLWSARSIVDVLKNLVSGLNPQWIRMDKRWKTPSKSSMARSTRTNQLLCDRRLFELVARPGNIKPQEPCKDCD